jgi:hypothetical protein
MNADIQGVFEESPQNQRLAIDLVNQKCSKCHSLERVLKANKNKRGWIKTVVRMAEKDAPNIRPFVIATVSILHAHFAQQVLKTDMKDPKRIIKAPSPQPLNPHPRKCGLPEWPFGKQPKRETRPASNQGLKR